MRSFLTAASTKVTDTRKFLRDAASGNSIKYQAERGAKHHIYIPYKEVQLLDSNGNPEKEIGPSGNPIFEMDPATGMPKQDANGQPIVKYKTIRELVSISGAVHEWQSPDGKFKATVCIKGVVLKDDNGNIINDGECPFCDRVGDAWDIYKYRKEREERIAREKNHLSGDALDKYLQKAKRTLADELKARETKSYLYLLVVKFRASTDGHKAVLGSDGLPEFDLRVMKLSQSRVEKIGQQIENSGMEMAGAEIMFQYADNDDRRLVVSQSTFTPVMPTMSYISQYPALKAKIDQEVAKFEWDGIEKSFPEWNGMTSDQAKKVTDELFEKWDEYKTLREANPAAEYMEYITANTTTTPALSGSTIPTPGAAVPSAATDTASSGRAANPAPPIPGVPGFDPSQMNAMFGGANFGGNGIPNI